MKEQAFFKVDSARNLMVVIIALAVGNRMICLGTVLYHLFITQSFYLTASVS
jgi:hypothetical protein